MSYETDQPTRTVKTVLTLWAVIVLLLTVVYFTYDKEPTPQTSSISTECEVGVRNPDGSITITENNPGSYEYTAYATAEGVKIMAPCN